MGVLTLTMSRFSGEDEAEDHSGSISQLVSRLRTAFRPADFNRAEEELVAREAKLKREIKMLRSENSVLREEVKSGVDFDDKDAVFELRRRNSELEIEIKKLNAQMNRKYEEWEKKIARLEDETAKLVNERRRGLRRIERRSENSGTIFGNGSTAASAPGSPLSVPSNSKGNGDQLAASGVGKFSSGGAIVISDSDDDCEPGDTVWKMNSLGKRKRASSICISDNENGGDNFEQEITPISEMKQHLKSGLEPSSSVVNHCSEVIVASSINDPTSHNALILREPEESLLPQDFIRSLGEGNFDCDSGDSSSLSSSSSDSEDDNRGQCSYVDAMEKVNAAQECSR